jgi:hypothetical protein
VNQKPFYTPIKLASILHTSSDASIAGDRRETYPDGLIHGFVAVAVGMLIVSESALLAREGGSALSGSSHYCPAE